MGKYYDLARSSAYIEVHNVLIIRLCEGTVLM